MLAKGFYWRNARCTKSRQDRCYQGYRSYEKSQHREYGRLSSAHAEQQIPHERCQTECQQKADSDAYTAKADGLPQYQLEHIPGLCTQSDADADFVRALRDGVGYEAIDSHCSQENGRPGKNTEHRKSHTPSIKSFRKILVKGSGIEDGLM
jgi:hypothetical protein